MKSTINPIDSNDNQFHDGNATTGEQGTRVTAKWLSEIQDWIIHSGKEFTHLLAQAGISIDEKDPTQVYQAISLLLKSRLSDSINFDSSVFGASSKAIKTVADKLSDYTPITQHNKDVTNIWWHLENSAIATRYDSKRHYHAGQILWHEGNWYECYHPDGCKGVNPSDPANRPTGWQITDVAHPYYWLKIGSALSLPEIGVPLPLPSLSLREGIIKYRNDTPLHKDKFWRLAESYSNLINNDYITITDLRGEFIRGLDDGRGVDSNRTLLSQQNDAIRNIMGAFTLGVHSSGRAWFSGANYPAPSTHDMAINNAILAPSNPVGFDASRVVPTANENRPRNIAFLYGTRF